jgi:hypothetical protein
MGRTMNGLVMVGAILAVIGLLGFAIPSFTTQHTEEVAHIGDLKLQNTESEHHFVPPAVSAGAVVLGIVLVGAGVATRRR